MSIRRCPSLYPTRPSDAVRLPVRHVRLTLSALVRHVRLMLSISVSRSRSRSRSHSRYLAVPIPVPVPVPPPHFRSRSCLRHQNLLGYLGELLPLHFLVGSGYLRVVLGYPPEGEEGVYSWFHRGYFEAFFGEVFSLLKCEFLCIEVTCSINSLSHDVLHQEKKKLRPERPDALSPRRRASGRSSLRHLLTGWSVSGHFPSGHSCVRAFSFWTQLCQGKWRLDDACHGTAVTLAVKARNIAVNTLVAFANTQQIPGIVTQSSSIHYI